MLSRIIVVIGILFINGCAGLEPKGPIYSEAPKPQITTEKTIVYILRTDDVPDVSGRRDIYVDSKLLLPLSDGGFTWFTIKPGKIEIKSDIPWMQRSINEPYSPKILNLNVLPNQTYYVHLNMAVELMDTETSIEFVGNTPVPVFNNIRDISEKLFEMDKKDALKHLPQKKYETPKWQ
jgi:hypothetical protein